MDFLITLISFIFVLGVLVFIHELGHFLVAKWAGIRVERFSLGYPPKMIGVTIGETEYCLSWLPLGGYVKVAGMADVGVEEIRGEPWEFMSKPVWVRMCVMAAGPLMNFLLGFFILFTILAIFGRTTIHTTEVGRVAPGSVFEVAGLQTGDHLLRIADKNVETWDEVDSVIERAWGRVVGFEFSRGARTRILDVALTGERDVSDLLYYLPSEVGSVLDGHPAENAGLKAGDRITAIDGKHVSQWWDLSDLIHGLPGKLIHVDWIRSGKRMSADIRADEYTIEGKPQGRIGIASPVPPTTRVPVGIWAAAVHGARQTWTLSGLIFRFVWRLVSGKESGQSLAGPLTIAHMAGKSARQGIESLMGFMALLSINLAVLNLLPIPVLDGGHLAVMAIESAVGLVTKRSFALSLRQKEILQQFGLVILGSTMIYVFYNDIIRLIGG